MKSETELRYKQTSNARAGQIQAGRARDLKAPALRIKNILYQLGAFNFSTTNLLIAAGATRKDIDLLSKAGLIEKHCAQYSLHDKDQGNPIFVWGLTKKGVREVKNTWPPIDWSDKHYDNEDIDWFDFKWLDIKPTVFRRNWLFSHNLIAQAYIVSKVSDLSVHKWGVTNMIYPKLHIDGTLSNTRFNMKDVGRSIWPDGFILSESGTATFIEIERHRKSSREMTDFFKKCYQLAIFHNVRVIATTASIKGILTKELDSLVAEGVIDPQPAARITIQSLADLPGLVLPGTCFDLRAKLAEDRTKAGNDLDLAYQMLAEMQARDRAGDSRLHKN